MVRIALGQINPTVGDLGRNAAKMVERRGYASQPESVLALAVRPDGRQLAVGRYDGALVLLDEATGKVQMLAARGPESGSAGYVALERIAGTLDGRAGTFAVVHLGPSTEQKTETEHQNVQGMPPGVRQLTEDGVLTLWKR